MTVETHESVTELDRLATGEDDFDVDLMACGCRLMTNTPWSIYDLIRVYQFDQDSLVSFVGALIDEGKIAPEKVIHLADQVVRGKSKEVDERRLQKAAK